MRKLSLIVLAMALPAPQLAQAQGAFDMTVLGMNGAIDQARQQARGQVRNGPPAPKGDARWKHRRAGNAGGIAALSPRALSPMLSRPSGLSVRAPASSADLTYTPSAEVRRTNFAQFVERSRERDPQTAGKLEQLFASQDVMKQADGWLASYGLRTTNVADTMAVYLATAWLAARGSDADPGKPEMLAVRNQIASAVAATPQFASATDAQKQEISEAMIIQAVLASQYATAAKSDPKLRESVREAVATGAKQTFGFDIRSLDLTAQGLR